jgi:phage shock protein PspC (stress-responsive transcriptional regulator)
MEKKLVRSSRDRKLTGVLGGLAAYFQIGVMPFAFLYVVAALVMPEEERQP